MGYTSYSSEERMQRATTRGYATKSVDQIFEQNTKRKIHEAMEPHKAILREARDSEAHPNSVPIILILDVTGSMGDIPHNLIKTGLPTMISTIIEAGVPDPAILIMAVGDSKGDGQSRYPLQIAQFESGDAELDMWLERIYIEGGGGGNGGESYNWGYYFAQNHVVTDAWEKRKEKGFIFTIGDDNCHRDLNKLELQEVMKDSAKVMMSDTEKVLADIKEKWNVFHINLDQHGGTSWRNLLGEGCIDMERRDYDGIAKRIAGLVVANTRKSSYIAPVQEAKTEQKPVDTTPSHPIIL